MLNRRSLFLIGGASILELSCGKPDAPPASCLATTLSPEAQAIRNSLKYVDRSLDSTKFCDVCIQYKPGASSECGRCSLFEGPVHPQGTCAAFAPKG